MRFDDDEGGEGFQIYIESHELLIPIHTYIAKLHGIDCDINFCALLHVYITLFVEPSL